MGLETYASDIFNYTDYFIGIGIDQYLHEKQHTHLSNAVRDTTEVREILVKRYGLLPENAFLLLDKQATKAEITKVFKTVAEKVKDKDRVIVHFSGHGFFDKTIEVGYWIPFEGDDSEAHWISEADIKNNIRRLKCRHVLVISDACFSGKFFRTSMQITSKGISKLHNLASRMALASGFDIVSDGEKGSNSPFTQSLITQLTNNAGSNLMVTQLRYKILSDLQGRGINQTPTVGDIEGAGSNEGGEFIFFVRSDSDEDIKSAFLQAADSGSIEQIRIFLISHQDSIYFNEALDIFYAKTDELIKKLENKEDIEGLNEFITQYDDFEVQVSKAREAIKRIEQKQHQQKVSLAWNQACQADTVSGYEAFINKYNNTVHAPEAKSRLQKARQKELLNDILICEDTVLIEQQIRQNILSNENKAKAKEHLQTVSVKQVVANPSVEAAQKLLDTFGDELLPDYKQQIDRLLATLQEQHLYEACQKTQSIELWADFLSKYTPNDKFHEEAVKQFRELCEPELYRHINSPELFNKYYRIATSYPIWTLNEPTIPTNASIRNSEFVNNANKYIALFPLSDNAKQLKTKVIEIEQDDLYKDTNTVGTIKAYASYWGAADVMPKTKAGFAKKYRGILFAVAVGVLAFAYILPWLVLERVRYLIEHKQQYNKAFKILKMMPESAEGLSYLATVYYEVGKKDEAYKYYLKAKDKGAKRSIFSLGLFSINGELIPLLPIDTAHGLELLKQAALLDEKRAHGYLAGYFESGLGKYLRPDSLKAYEHYTRAAKLGLPASQYKIGEIHYWGYGNIVEADKKKAAVYYRMAAQNNHADAKCSLGWMYRHHNEGVDTSTTKALYWLKAAAKDSVDWAFIELGDYYSEQNNHKLAASYYYRSATRGTIYGHRKMGDCYYHGLGCKKSLKDAIYWYKIAAEYEDTIAMHQLANIYQDSLAIRPSLCNSVKKWLKAGIGYGYSVDARLLGDIYYHGYCGAINMDSAGIYYQDLLDQEDPQILKNMGDFYFNEKKYESAISMYAKLPYDAAPDLIGENSLGNICVLYEQGHINKNYLNNLSAALRIARERSLKTELSIRLIHWLDTLVDMGDVQHLPIYIQLVYRQIFVNDILSEDAGEYFAAFRNPNYSQGGNQTFLEPDFYSTYLPKNKRYVFKKSLNANLSYQNKTAALMLLGSLYEYQNPVHLNSAYYYYQLAAAQGDIYAAYKLAVAYKTGESGASALGGKNYEKAISHYKKVISLNTDKSYVFRAYLHLGQISTIKNGTTLHPNYDETIGYYQKALELAPKDVVALTALCTIFYENGKMSIAKNYCVAGAENGNKECQDKCKKQSWDFEGLDLLGTPGAESKGLLQKIADLLKSN